ncbi:MAG: hypothetical protein FJ149_08770 [Euryarchaeota archaeon]|nr:hypothetical protein [Euryarchaeota archaeon]
MNARGRVGLIVATVVLSAVIGYILADLLLPEDAPGMQGDSGVLLAAKSVLTTVNTGLCIVLIAGYLRLYSEVRSRFTLGLLFMTFALLIYAATSNPVIHALWGYCLAGLGPFTMIPDIFAAAALATLLHLSES